MLNENYSTTWLLLSPITDSRSLHELVASTNSPSSSCCLILWAILISKMSLLDNRENGYPKEQYSFFSIWEDEKQIYLFDFFSPLSSSRERSLRRGPHANCNDGLNMKNKNVIVQQHVLVSRTALLHTTKSSGEIQLSPNATPTIERKS